jgi:hypothetical protein
MGDPVQQLVEVLRVENSIEGCGDAVEQGDNAVVIAQIYGGGELLKETVYVKCRFFFMRSRAV